MVEILTLILGFMMLVVTGVYVYYTKQLVRETIKIREVETSPLINVHIDLDSGLSTIVIKNIGKAPAYDLEIEFEEDKFKEIRKDLCNDFEGKHKSRLTYFGVDQELLLPFNTKKLFDKNIVLVLKYKSKENRIFNEKMVLGLQAEKDMNVSYPKTPYHDDLKKINDELKNIGKQVSKFQK